MCSTIAARSRSAVPALTVLALVLASPGESRAQERTVAMVPSAQGTLQVRVLGQGGRIAVTMEKNGRSVLDLVLAPDEAVHLAAALTEAADSATARGRSQSSASEKTAVPTYFAFQVDRQAALIPGTLSPNYPSGVSGSQIAGVVEARIVVDTTGSVVPGTLTVLSSPGQAFTTEFARAIPAARFSPALKNGAKVRQLMSLRYDFTHSR